MCAAECKQGHRRSITASCLSPVRCNTDNKFAASRKSARVTGRGLRSPKTNVLRLGREYSVLQPELAYQCAIASSGICKQRSRRDSVGEYRLHHAPGHRDHDASIALDRMAGRAHAHYLKPLYRLLAPAGALSAP